MYQAGGTTWEEWYSKFQPVLLARQQPDGSFGDGAKAPENVVQSPVLDTGFAVTALAASKGFVAPF